jgi:protein-arginine kinase activator protein McsA
MYRRNFLTVKNNNGFHPIIAESKLCIGDKLVLQHLLENEFNYDILLLLKDMMKHAIEMEEYEVAAILRDELNKGI